MAPAGYVIMQQALRLDRPVQAYDRWMARIPAVYREAVLDEKVPATAQAISGDPYHLGGLKSYRSLGPLAREARKPMFFLKPADGALGGHARAVEQCYKDFRALAERIAARCGIAIP
jgi:hypothetical protein